MHMFFALIEETLNKINKSKNMNVGHSSDNSLYEPKPMENNNRTLKELAMLDVLYQPLCIHYPHLEPT
ncbi:hypothetical protein CR513_39816, partial [Mucuna pruriens]